MPEARLEAAKLPGMTEPDNHNIGPESSRPPVHWGRPVVMCLVLAAALAVVYASPLRHYLEHVRDLKQSLADLGIAGPLLYMLAVFLLVAAGCPRLLFCPLGGMAFGVGFGLLWTQIPTLLGYYVTFLFVRWGGRGFSRHHWPRLDNATQCLEGRSWVAVFLMRQLPMPGVVVNLLLGLSPLRHRTFLLGTALGLLPQAVPATMIGKSFAHMSPEAGSLILGAAMILFLLAILGLRRYADSIPWLHGLREALGKRPAQDPPAPE